MPDVSTTGPLPNTSVWSHLCWVARVSDYSARALDIEASPAAEDEAASLSDIELAELLRVDARAAAPRLYERFAPTVNRLVWHLLGADLEHNDLVQQVFLRVLKSGARLRDSERLSQWVRAITVNTVYAELRRRTVRRLFWRQQPAARAHADLVRDVEARDLLMRAKAVIDKLPASERVVFVLYFVEGQTLGEIAELLRYSHATAKRRVRKASLRFQRLAADTPELLRVLGEPKEER